MAPEALGKLQALAKRIDTLETQKGGSKDTPVAVENGTMGYIKSLEAIIMAQQVQIDEMGRKIDEMGGGTQTLQDSVAKMEYKMLESQLKTSTQTANNTEAIDTLGRRISSLEGGLSALCRQQNRDRQATQLQQRQT